jgi:cbb3-type cytochrome c oxidase subunit I/cbb3-type cytochrome c oxidase subunit II
MSEPRIETRLIRAHGVAALAMVVVSALFGVLVATKFVLPDFLGGTAWTTWGRLRYNHTQGILFGFLGNAFLAFLYHAVPRLAERPVLSRGLGWWLFGIWNFCVVLPGWVLVFAGFGQPLEWAEFPLIVACFVMLGFVLSIVQFVTPFLKKGASGLYVSGWYIIGGLIFTALAYPVGNLAPQLLPGALGAAFSGLWIHDAVGLYVTPLALAIAYFVIPVATGRPIYSHFLSMIGFWLLFFVYPLNGMHHYVFSSIPMEAQKAAIAASAYLGMDVILVVTNLLLSLRGRAAKVRQDTPLLFVWTGVVIYLVVSLQGSFQALMPVNRFVHFSDWVIGHSHLAMLGFAGLTAVGGIAHVWQRTPGFHYSEPAIRWSYWSLTIGLVLMVADLTLAGLVEAHYWQTHLPWTASIVALTKYWWVRLISALPIVLGFVFFCFGILTGPLNGEGEAREEREETPSITPDIRVGRWLETAYTMTFVAGVGFFMLSFVVLGVLPGRALAREIRQTAPTSMPELTASEARGRTIYGREGCAYCHTQQVRFAAADRARWGQPTEAWETRYEYPQMWGTRRIGPDLARESAVHSDDWQLAHLNNPQAVVAGSNMPPFPWLFAGSAAQPTQDAIDLLAYIQSLGRPRQLAGYDSVPEPSRAPVLKISTDPAVIERGAGLFRENCASCHGTSGRGDGPGADGLFPRPANLTMMEYSDDRLSHILWSGVPGSAMTRWNRLSTADIEAVEAYVRTLEAGEHGSASANTGVIEQGRDLYRQNCTGCHGMEGRGNGPAAAALAPSPTNFHEQRPAKAHALHALKEGVPGTAMPPWGVQMSDGQREAVAAYLDSLYEPPVQ